ncbi:MAG: hypothetical protein MK066_10460 [Crocinitomicaceae bacterium]|nr:hypothetical protein [Crocinitomicaceae bacterium]
MNTILSHGLRFGFFLLVQVLILNQIEIGVGTQLMIYPLFIALLPVEMNTFVSLSFAFTLGVSIDAMSNTYGLHTSSLLVFAYLKPIVYSAFAPRDGYDQVSETNIHEMGLSWFLRSFGLLLLIHHLWFFTLEMFKLNEILFVLQKTILSVIMSFIVCILLQYLFIRKPKET